jgi:hypothetical protein
MPAVWLTVLVRLGWFVTKQHDLTTDSEDRWPVIFAAAVAGYTPLSDQASIRKLEVVQRLRIADRRNRTGMLSTRP